MAYYNNNNNNNTNNNNKVVAIRLDSPMVMLNNQVNTQSVNPLFTAFLIDYRIVAILGHLRLIRLSFILSKSALHQLKLIC